MRVVAILPFLLLFVAVMMRSGEVASQPAGLNPAGKWTEHRSEPAFTIPAPVPFSHIRRTGTASVKSSGVKGTEERAASSSGPDPLRALWRSFVIPGWGHHYADPGDWRRGQYHLGAEVILFSTYLGIRRQAYVVEKNMYTHAGAFSGVNIRERDRQYEIAVGNYNSLEAYNDYQERIRNLDRLYPDTPEYRWEWESEERRLEYRELRSRRDNLKQQLPALVGFMVVNRVISGISAYSRVRSATGASASLHIVPGPDLKGFEALVSFSF